MDLTQNQSFQNESTLILLKETGSSFVKQELYEDESEKKVTNDFQSFGQDHIGFLEN
jgi:hypothetical protein